MVEVGQIEITGTMNDADIEQGFDRIQSDFENMENQANQTDASMSNLADTAAGLGKSLIAIGTVGVGAITALATKSPMLANTFARLEVTMLKLSNTVGPMIRPIFEGTIDFLQDFDSWLNRNEGTISSITSTIGEGIGDIGSVIQGEWNNINNIIPKGSGVATGIALGSKFGFKGMLLGAALGYIAGDSIGTNIPEEDKQWWKDEQKEMSSKYTPENYGDSQMLAAFASMPEAFANLPREINAVRKGFVNWINSVLGDTNDKDMQMANATGTTRGD